MFTRPDALRDADIVSALADGWGLRAQGVDYVAVGYGSHHWNVTGEADRWFVSVDDLEARRRDATETRRDAARRLSAALTVAGSLCDAGLDFVVAPTSTLNGTNLHPIDDRYVLALYPYINGEVHAYGPYPTRPERLAVLDRVCRVHAVDPSVAGSALADDFLIPRRDELVVTPADHELPWGPGPYAAPARARLGRHRESLWRVLEAYDELVLQVAAQSGRWVLTHGEPHRGNTINTDEGVVLIDWDTALLAPPERDLWALIDEDSAIAADYLQRTGRAVDGAAVQVYRRWWDLCEIALSVADLRRPHRDTADSRAAWDQLTNYLDPTRWSDVV